MNLDSAAEILLIIVSSVLALFLVILIVLAVKIIKITRSLRRITERAERISAKAETIGEYIAKSSGPAVAVKSVISMVSNLVNGSAEETKRSSRKGKQ